MNLLKVYRSLLVRSANRNCALSIDRFRSIVFSLLISMLVSDTSQIASGHSHICSRRRAPTCNFLATRQLQEKQNVGNQLLTYAV